MPPIQEEDCDAYNNFRDECFKRIESHAADGEEFCFYVVPPFHFGLPVYDPDNVFLKLYAELSQLNYQLLAWPNARRIFIAWYEEEETAAEYIRSAVNSYQQQHQMSSAQSESTTLEYGELEDEDSSDEIGDDVVEISIGSESRGDGVVVEIEKNNGK